MAGPLSSEEIEDVVSSVRRLVSNEQRVMTRDLNAERLVLTSDYRVVPETSPLAPVSPVAALSPLMLDAPLVEAPPERERVALDVLEDASAPHVADALEETLTQPLAEPELTGDVGGQMAAETPMLPPDAAPEAPFADTAEAEWEDEIWTGPDQVSLGEVALAAEEAEVLTAPEPETEPAEATDRGWTEEPIPFVPLHRRAEDLAARVAAGEVVEASDAPAPETPAPVEAASAMEPSPEKSAPAEVAPASPAAAPDPSPQATDLYDADGTPLAVLDEAALNEIVRQVLRAELQGELGERITRNVRKLVRAEINRALMARDLD